MFTVETPAAQSEVSHNFFFFFFSFFFFPSHMGFRGSMLNLLLLLLVQC